MFGMLSGYHGGFDQSKTAAAFCKPRSHLCLNSLFSAPSVIGFIRVFEHTLGSPNDSHGDFVVGGRKFWKTVTTEIVTVA